ncbi:MAG: sulfite exporter TauE/SafE family protein, partial [Planctomycetota bacterium]
RMDEISIYAGLMVAGVGFLCQYLDATLGMGYGITLAPLLLLLGFEPLEIVPAALVSQFAAGVLGGLCHHCYGNADLLPRAAPPGIVAAKIRELGYLETFRRGLPRHLKVALLLGACGIPGAIMAVAVAISIPPIWLELYIGFLVISIGVVLLVFRNRVLRFSWIKLGLLGTLASFNKGLTGGGYGPLVTSGQLLSGVDGKGAVGVTTVAQGLACFAGIVCYVFVDAEAVSWALVPYTLAGGVVALPLCGLTVSKLGTMQLRNGVALFTLLLGILTLAKAVL